MKLIDYSEGFEDFRFVKYTIGAKRRTTIEAMSATISVNVIPTGTGTPTKKNCAWSPGARNTYSMAATTPVIAAICGFLKIKISDAKSRTVPARKSGIRA